MLTASLEWWSPAGEWQGRHPGGGGLGSTFTPPPLWLPLQCLMLLPDLWACSKASEERPAQWGWLGSVASPHCVDGGRGKQCVFFCERHPLPSHLLAVSGQWRSCSPRQPWLLGSNQVAQCDLSDHFETPHTWPDDPGLSWPTCSGLSFSTHLPNPPNMGVYWGEPCCIVLLAQSCLTVCNSMDG